MGWTRPTYRRAWLEKERAAIWVVLAMWLGVGAAKGSAIALGSISHRLLEWGGDRRIESGEGRASA